MAADTITLAVNTEPLEAFTKIVDGFLKTINSGVSVGELPPELARIEPDNAPAGTGELRMILYPSDAFLRHVGALWARNPDLLAVK
jgi:hypothetical protein